MTTTSKAAPESGFKNTPSTRHLVVNGRFAALLEEDFGIPWDAILEALQGEPQKAAIKVCQWATEKTDDPARALICWAKKHQRGAFGTAGGARDGISRDRSGTGRATDTPRPVNALRGALWGAADGKFDRAGVA